MNEHTKRNNGRMLLTIIGFIIVIIFAVWVAIKIVTLIPSAFSSLASIADGVYGERPQNEIIVANPNSIVNNDEATTIAWTDLKRKGVYTFSYECTDGVAIDMRHPGATITKVPCGEAVALGSDTTKLEITVNSEKRRFIDVPYTVSFTKDGDTQASYDTTTVLTVVNANIPQSQSITTTEPEDDTQEETDTPTGEVAGETTEVAVTPNPTPVTPREPEVITTEIYELPTSDPDGFVDLAVKYIAVGTLASNNRFIPTGVIDQDARGAFQFEVLNLGTKTSDDWVFEATLTSGTVYESKKQDGLLPNERSVITIGFDAVGDEGAQRFGAEVDVDDDINKKNNDFTWAVNVID